MTTAELQALRSALYTQYLAWINAGCPQSYTLPGGKGVTKVDGNFWLKQINDLDAAIAQQSSGGGFFVGAFRNPE